MTKPIRFVFALFLCLFAIPVHADGTHPLGIKLDGSVGKAGKIELPGTDYEIKAEYGKQVGPNLVHSFEQFNIHAGESATFTGPDSVKNIISRVTGGNASWINGNLVSTIPNADVYFLNPSGVMFGQYATLALSGSFHVSTADYLKMGDDERFYSKPKANEVLSFAAPKEFGFLSDKPAKISLEGANLEVSEGKDISLIGGDIGIRKSTLTVPKGRVFVEGHGNIDMSDSLIQQEGGGKIIVRGGKFYADNTQFFINASDENSGSADIDAHTVSFNNSMVDTSPNGGAKGGDLILKAEDSVFLSKTNISTYTESNAANAKDSGNVRISANSVSVTDSSNINASTFGTGIGGEILIDAKGSVSCSDSTLFAVTQSQDRTAGNAGKIRISADDISIRNSDIRTGTGGAGNGGNIVSEAEDSIILSKSKITSVATGKGEISGKSGNISLKAKDISLKSSGDSSTDASYLDASTFGNGDGGDITVNATGTVSITGLRSGIFTNTGSFADDKAAAGNITIFAEKLYLSEKAEINASSLRGGKAGTILLHVGDLDMDSESSIISESPFANAFTDLKTVRERDERILIPGNRIIIKNAYDGKSQNLVYAGGYSLSLFATHYVSNISELNKLPDKNLVIYGDIAEVADAGDGKSGRFIYTDPSLSGWVRFYDNRISDVADNAALNQLNYKFLNNVKEAPYAPGDVIRVRDAGNGKAGLFVYTIAEYDWGAMTNTIRLSHFSVGNASEMNHFAEQYSVSDNDRISVKDSKSGFVFEKNEWIKLTDNIHSISDWTEYGKMISYMAMVGNVAAVKDGGDGKPKAFVYSGKDWITLNNAYSVAKSSERDSLSVRTGDVVYVADDGAGKSAIFLYDGGQWIRFPKGDSGTIEINADSVKMKNKSKISSTTYGNGDASDIVMNVKNLETDSGSHISSESNSQYFGGDSGKITINVADLLKLSGNSYLTTNSTDAGGGEISVNAKNLIYLNNGDITGSVKQGVGKGGDIEVSSKFMILNQGNIKANAEEGDGGAVFIRAENFLKSAESIVEASSARGNQGTVRIEAPDLNLSGGLTIMPGNFLDATRFATSTCEERSGGTRGRLEIHTHVIRPEPFGDQP